MITEPAILFTSCLHSLTMCPSTMQSSYLRCQLHITNLCKNTCVLSLRIIRPYSMPLLIFIRPYSKAFSIIFQNIRPDSTPFAIISSLLENICSFKTAALLPFVYPPLFQKISALGLPFLLLYLVSAA